MFSVTKTPVYRSSEGLKSSWSLQVFYRAKNTFFTGRMLEKLSKESSISKIEENQTLSMMEADDGVGELEAQGFALGVAPLDWRPAKMVSENPTTAKASASALLQETLRDDESSYGGVSTKRNVAFREFKHTISEGIQQCFILNGKKSELKEKKLMMQSLAVKLNDCKQEIQELNVRLARKANDVIILQQTEAEKEDGGDEQGLFEERLEQAKSEYQRCFAELVQSKDQIQSARKEILECQESLLDSFFKWYKREREK